MSLTAAQLRSPASKENIEAMIEWQESVEDGSAIAAGSLTNAQLQQSTTLTPASDAVPTIVRSTKHIELISTTGAKAILTDTSGDDAVQVGQTVHISVPATCSGGSYTLALVTGTLTLNAVGEGATVMRTSAGWVCVGLGSATIV